jgi:hypothetical protein
MLPSILKAVDRLGHTVFDSEHIYNLNIVGIRSDNRDQSGDAFDDWITCTYREPGGAWVTDWWQATTDPGLQSLRHPEMYNAEGTAIMVPGQYPAAYILGLHRGKYEALVQRGPGQVRYTRDANRDGILDLNQVESGHIGLNIHRAGNDSAHISGVSNSGKPWAWSAGCQVFKRHVDFESFIHLCHLQTQTHPGWAKTFTYTLIEDKHLWT